METKKLVKKQVESKETFLDKLKKNWKIIVIIILMLFSVSKCTSSCNRGHEIDRLNYQIVQMDSVITSNGIELDKLNMRLDDAKSSIDNYKGIATGNQQDLINKVETLTNENKNLQNKVNTLTKENGKLNKKIEELENEVQSTRNN